MKDNMQTRSVIVSGTVYNLKLIQSTLGKWSVFGRFPNGGGRVIAGCKSTEAAVAAWILTVRNHFPDSIRHAAPS
jgi:hypothetical protein